MPPLLILPSVAMLAAHQLPQSADRPMLVSFRSEVGNHGLTRNIRRGGALRSAHVYAERLCVMVKYSAVTITRFSMPANAALLKLT